MKDHIKVIIKSIGKLMAMYNRTCKRLYQIDGSGYFKIKQNFEQHQKLI